MSQAFEFAKRVSYVASPKSVKPGQYSIAVAGKLETGAYLNLSYEFVAEVRFKPGISGLDILSCCSILIFAGTVN